MLPVNSALSPTTISWARAGKAPAVHPKTRTASRTAIGERRTKRSSSQSVNVEEGGDKTLEERNSADSGGLLPGRQLCILPAKSGRPHCRQPRGPTSLGDGRSRFYRRFGLEHDHPVGCLGAQNQNLREERAHLAGR